MCFVCVNARAESGEHPGHIEVDTSSTGFTVANSSILQVAYAQVAAAELTDNAATLIEGVTWGGQVGVAATVTYTFDINSINSSLVFADDIRAFDSAEQTSTLGVFDKLSAITNLTFVQSASAASADISFYVGDITFDNVVGIAAFLNTGASLTEAAVGIDTTFSDFETTGTFDYVTLLHEIGHAVGLKHPGNYGDGDKAPFLSADDDNLGNTVMSYNDTDGSILTNPSNYQQFDIEALEYLYGDLGASDTTDGGGGDTTDGGGSDDTTSGGGTDDDGNGSDDFLDDITATGTTGTSGDDVLVASGSGQSLAGAAGADEIFGNLGADTLYGGTGIVDPSDGNDTISGGAGADLIFGNTGDDSITGAYTGENAGDGNDTVYGGFGFDTIDGDIGDDYLAGGGGLAHPDDEADTIDGGDGDDFLIGNGGGDSITGGSGEEVIWAGFGNDTVDGGSDNDFISGQQGNDSLSGGTGNDTFYFYGGDGVDTITDWNFGDVVRLESNINGGGLDTSTEVYTSLQISGTTATLDLGGGNTITFLDVVRADFSVGSFEIV